MPILDGIILLFHLLMFIVFFLYFWWLYQSYLNCGMF
jgi:hypothetical protein